MLYIAFVLEISVRMGTILYQPAEICIIWNNKVHAQLQY